MSSVIGFVDLHDEANLGRLTESRPLGSVTFLGRYGIIDFVLSNFSNSGIDKVQILVPNHFDSLRSHLLNGSVWVRNTKIGYLRPVLNEKGLSNPNQNTDISNIVNNIPSSAIDGDYIVVAPSRFLSSMDFNPIIKAHIESGREITVVCTHTKNGDTEFKGCSEVEIDRDGSIISSHPHVDKKDATISLDTFIFNQQAFFEMLSFARELSSNYSIKKMVAHFVNNHIAKINSFIFPGYVVPILSLRDYVKYSFDLLNYNKREKLFLPDWPIYTTTHNTPPAFYGEKSEVSNSFVTNGARIYGKVKNSIICRDVVVEEGAEVKNSIILSHSVIGSGVTTNYVVTDKDVKIYSVKEVIGESECPLFLVKGSEI